MSAISDRITGYVYSCHSFFVVLLLVVGVVKYESR